MASKTFNGSCVFWLVYRGWQYSCCQIDGTMVTTSIAIVLWTGVLGPVVNLAPGLYPLQIHTRKSHNSDHLLTVQQWLWMLICCSRLLNRGTLRRVMQTSGVLIRQHCGKETIGKQAVAVLCTLMLPWMMVSHIPFIIPTPIFIIAGTQGTTKYVIFMKSSRAGQLYITIIDSSYMGHRERITGAASTPPTTMGKKKPVQYLLYLHSTDSQP